MLKSLKITFLCFMLFAMAIRAKSQSYDWWNTKHNWNGSTPWFRMMTVSAKNFGPNALPVLESNEARIEKGLQFEFRPEFQTSRGDQTYNLFSSLKASLGNVASFEVFIVPLEYYKMDTLLRDKRLARNANAEGLCGGDFWFGTNVQIIKDKKFPDLMASFYFKTASGTNLMDARYTDATAYSIAVSSGKDVFTNAQTNTNLRLFAGFGTYIWQTHSDINNQDDALSYSLGVLYSKKSLHSKLEYAGYHGYLNNGDRPSVIRFSISHDFNALRLGIRLQQGIHDFNYTTIGLSLGIRFKNWALH